MHIIPQEPQFGVNYDVGYMGCTYHADNIVCLGIAHFTDYQRLGNIIVTHVFGVSGKNRCVQAHVGVGVHNAPLEPLFDDPNCHVFFRKPVGWTPALGKRIIATMESELGKRYDTPLIAAHALIGSFLGRILSRLPFKTGEEVLCGLLNHRERWMCSELYAYGLDEQPEYHDQGCLRQANEAITPQELFEDNELFEDWHDNGDAP